MKIETLYCNKCEDYIQHEDNICYICSTEYDVKQKRYIIAGDPNHSATIKARKEFIAKHPDAILINEDKALTFKLGVEKKFDTYNLVNTQDIDQDMVNHIEEMRYSHLTKKEREAKIHPVRIEPKIRRNDPCPCGSGKKYKKCCK